MTDILPEIRYKAEMMFWFGEAFSLPPVPSGTTENSPAIHCRGQINANHQVP